jgi:hypothetical protein
MVQRVGSNEIEHSYWSRALDESQGPRQIKLWFSLHDIILEGKPIGAVKKKDFKEELMVWRIKS